MNIRRLGVFLAVWSFGFACAHVAWAAGWRGGVPTDVAPISERPVFLAYDLVAGLLMYAAAVVCLLLVSGGYPRRTWPGLLVATLVGSCLALARGVPALIWDSSAGEISVVGFGADVWFTVAGVAGLVLHHRSATQARTMVNK